MRADLLSSLAPLRSQLLAAIPGVAHAVTRRVPGMGLADGNIGFSRPRNLEDAWAMRQVWSAAAGLDANRLVTLGQVHGATVLRATAAHRGWGATPGSRQIGLGDALITDEPGPVLMTLHADCQAILLVDPGRGRRGPAVAVVHAGWRGTVADVVGQTIASMAAAYGTRAANLRVYLGPAIGGCCYAVGEEVVASWRARAGAEADDALQDGERQTFSLVNANLLLMERAGVREEHVEASPICTRCDGLNWFSHRGQGPDTGRFGAMIAIRHGADW